MAKLVVEARHDTHGIGRHEPIGTAANDGKDRDDDERQGYDACACDRRPRRGAPCAWTLSIVMQETGVGISTLGIPKSLSKAGSTQVSLGSAASERTAAAEAGACGTSVSICSCVRRGKPAVRPAARSDAAASSERIPGAGRPHLGHVRSCGERRAPQPSQNTNSVCSGPSPGPT